jgi:hypothetical protein
MEPFSQPVQQGKFQAPAGGKQRTIPVEQGFKGKAGKFFRLPPVHRTPPKSLDSPGPQKTKGKFTSPPVRVKPGVFTGTPRPFKGNLPLGNLFETDILPNFFRIKMKHPISPIL